MRAEMHRLEPGENSRIVAQRLVSSRLVQFDGWDPNPLFRRWNDSPPQRSTSKKNPHGNTTTGPTPGTLPGASLDDAIKGLRQNCPNITAELTGIQALDALIRKPANEVGQILIPNAALRLQDIIVALADTAGVTESILMENFDAVIKFSLRILEKNIGASRQHLQGALDYLKHTGLLVPSNVIPAKAHWTPLPGHNEPQEISVPFDVDTHDRLHALMSRTGLGKEFICDQLVVAALGNLNPKFHFERQLEIRIMRHKLKQVLQLDKVIMGYESQLKTPLPTPEKDPGLAPFIAGLRNRLDLVKGRAGVVRSILASAIVSRGDDVAYSNLIERAAKARRLVQLCRSANPPTSDALHKLQELLHELL
jgi:hypothetical protein